MPYKPLNDEQRKQLEEKLREAKERLNNDVLYIQNLEENLRQGNWFMSDEDTKKMNEHIQEILAHDREREEEQRRTEEEQKGLTERGMEG